MFLIVWENIFAFNYIVGRSLVERFQFCDQTLNSGKKNSVMRNALFRTDSSSELCLSRKFVIRIRSFKALGEFEKLCPKGRWRLS